MAGFQGLARIGGTRSQRHCTAGRVSTLRFFWELSASSREDSRGDWHSWSLAPDELKLAIALISGSIVIFLVGLLDDIKQLRPATKFLGQLAAASFFIFAGGIFHLTGLNVVDVLITYLWFTGITNAINMLDNMDGLSSGVVIIAGTVLVLLTAFSSDGSPDAFFVVPLSVCLISALFGFWLHNKPPAKIFMGDSGSLFIGYVLAGLTIPSQLNGFIGRADQGVMLGPVFTLIIPVTILAVPIFDTVLVTVTRMWRAQPPSVGGRDHSSHRLVGLGLREVHAVWLLYAVSAMGGILAVLLQKAPTQSLPLFGFFGLVLALIGVYLGQVKVQTSNPNINSPAWTPLVSKILYKRHVAELLVDLILVVICFHGAYLLRFGGDLQKVNSEAVLNSLPIVVASCLVCFFLTGAYRGQWKLISVAEVPHYIMGTICGTALSFLLVMLIYGFREGHSHSAFIVFGFLVFVAQVGLRLSFRVFDSFLAQKGSFNSSGKINVLIYGAGKAGKLLFEEIVSNDQMKDYVIAGFIDDNPNLMNRKLCGVNIKGGSHWFKQPWKELPEVWVSSKFISEIRIKKLLKESGFPKLTVRRLLLLMEPALPRQIVINSLKNDLGDSKLTLVSQQKK